MITDEKGFTLIELLVTMAIISILAGLSIESVSIYRESAYNKIALNAMHSARTALEAGITDLEEEEPGWFGRWSNTPGQVLGWGGERFLPGYVNPKNVEISAFYNSWCDIATLEWCLREGVFTRHCKAGKMTSWFRWKNGVETTTVHDGPPTC